MRNRKIIYSGLFVGCIIMGILALIIFSSSQKLSVTFLDVGQGDSILISEGSNQILIDGGPSGQILTEKLGKHIPFWDRKIEMVIATHPDQDHIEGLIAAIRNYEVEMVMENSREAQTKVYQNLKNIIQEKEVEKIDAEVGMKVKFGNGAILEIIHASKENTKETNSKSIVAKLTFGQNSFLLTGDLPDNEEGKLSDVNARILKVSHHGSKNATTEIFLNKINAESAIISVGKNNRYGHPAPEVLERLKKAKLSTFRTDKLGDIQFICQNPENDCEAMGL